MVAMDELEPLLQSLQALKAPGITKTKIDAITQLCVQHVQSDATIVQKIVQAFKNSPATHKLGVLYIVDSVTRQWVEKAKQAGQNVSKNAVAGTFGSGVQKVTDMLPTLMSDLVQSVPENQKEKVSKLLDIWERGHTFPQGMLAAFKMQLNRPQNAGFTPPGSPPKIGTANGQTNVQPPVAAPIAVPIAGTPNAGTLLATLAGFGQQNGQATNPMNPMPAAPPTFPFAQNAAPPPPVFFPPPPVAATAPVAAPPSVTPDMAGPIFQAIMSGAIPPEQAMGLLALLSQAQANAAAAPMPMPPQQPPAALSMPPLPPVAPSNTNGAQTAFNEPNHGRYRERSRSPETRQRRQSPPRRSPPFRRGSPVYEDYNPSSKADNKSGYERERGRGRGGKQRGGRNDRNEYRQRSPPAQRRPSPNRGPQQKFLEWDYNMPRDHIKVLSRTLFVGGASGTEDEIRAIFSRFGRVQTCIVAQEKRHAFVKMVNRADACAAKEGMDKMTDHSALAKARQTRWGVGFGPRDCSDYNTGISIIPIARLTDADRKWVVNAEFGGTGGRPLESGMVLEEPDIEIGAGVSSKAISKRVGGEPPHRGGQGRGARGRGFDNSPRFRAPERGQMHQTPQAHNRHFSPRAEVSVAVPPAVPGFGFQLPPF